MGGYLLGPGVISEIGAARAEREDDTIYVPRTKQPDLHRAWILNRDLQAGHTTIPRHLSTQ